MNEVDIAKPHKNTGKVPWNKGLNKETDERVRKNGIGTSKALIGKISPNRIHSFDPKDWVCKCTGCGVDLLYKDRDTYKNAIIRIRKTGSTKCLKCRMTDKLGRKASDETRAKQSAAAKVKILTPEALIERSRKLSESHKKRYANMSVEDKTELLRLRQIGYDNMPDETRSELRRKLSEKRRQEMADNGESDKFRPSYNKKLIPYIDTILNEEYNCKFRHAESAGGEFRIYDKEFKKSYYADAYSAELNLWVEFDEYYHTVGNNKELDKIREERIKFILGCRIIRFNVCDVIVE